jgi:hypothetical protein
MHLPIECIMDNYCMRWRHCFKGLSLDGGLADFSRKPVSVWGPKVCRTVEDVVRGLIYADCVLFTSDAQSTTYRVGV